MQEPRTAPVAVSRTSIWLQRFDWKYVIFGLVAIILVYQIGVPLVILVWGSFTDALPGDPSYFNPAAATVSNYTRALSSPFLFEAAYNTAIFSVGLTTLAFVLGASLAWIVVRTNTPFGTFITILMYVRFIIPGILTTVAWLYMGSPRIGLINTWFSNTFGFDQPIINIYSMAGMIFVEAMDILPLAFILTSAALRSMDPALEEASLASGKNVLQTTRRVTFPLILPAILAALLLMFIRGIETFEVPFLLGLPAGITTFVTEIYLNTATSPTDHGRAGAYAVMVLLVAVFLLWTYNRMTRRSASYATITGKAFRPRVINLGRWRWATFGYAFLVMFFSLLLPFAILLWASFLPRLQPFSAAALSDLTLSNYDFVLNEYPLTRRAFWNSTLLGVTAASAIVLLISITAWITVKSRIKGRKWLDHIAFAPIAIPAIMMGVAFLWLYISMPLPVYGTMLILFLLYVSRYTPLVMRILSANMMQINNELQEAAEISGASWWRSFRTVILPLLRPGMVVAWVFVVIHAFRELSGSLIVYSSGNEVVSIAILDLWGDGSYSLLASFGVLIFAVLLVLAIGAQFIGSRFGVKGT